MTKYIGLILFILISVLGYSQGGHYCSKTKSYSNHHHQTRSNTLTPAYISLTEEYDVHFYKLDLNVERTSTDISGSVQIHATSTVAMLDSVIIELHEDLTVHSILVDNIATIAFTRVGSSIIVPVSYSMNDSFIVTIDYSGTPPNPTTYPQGGGGISNATSGSWGNRVTWTLSEPFSAFEWWPCKQSLTDKADSVYVFVTTNSSNMAGSIGKLTDIVDLGNGTKRYEWKSNYPIDYYLVSISVAEYVEYNVYANPVGAPNPVLIQNFIYNNPNTLPYFQADINKTVDFMEYFSELYGLYPFHAEKYGHCMAPFSGGMEHQTMTTQGFFNDGLTVHELGHQWFGDNVTTASWSEIWLNEGFASYTEHLMEEHFDPGTQHQSMLGRHNNIMSQTGGSVWVEDSLNDARIFSSRLTYDKGAAIVHTLRFLIDNDIQFFQILKQYQINFGGSTATLSDFKQLAESITGKDFTSFFNEWFYGEGYPTYSCSWGFNANNVTIKLSQVTSEPSITNFFSNDLEIKIVGTDGTSLVQRLDVTSNNELFVIPFNSNVANIEIDPNNWIINKSGTITEDVSLSVLEGGSKDEILIYPNPVSDVVTLMNINQESLLFVYDNYGKLVASYSLKTGENKIDVKELPNGTYIFKIGASTKEVIVQK